MLYIRSPFVHAFLAFHLLAVSLLQSQEMSSNTVIIVISLGFVIDLSGLAKLAGFSK